MLPNEIPDFVRDAGEMAINLYKEYKQADTELNEHHERLQVVQTVDNETFTVDMCGTWYRIEIILKRNKAEKKEIERLKKLSKSFYLLKANKANAKKRLFKEVHKGKNNKTPLSIERERVLDLFASFYTSSEIKEILNKDFGYKLKTDQLKQFAYVERNEIDRRQKQKISSNKSLRIAQETGRLEILSELHFYYYRNWQKSRNPSDSKMCMYIIEQARKEVKGNEVKLTIDGKIDINTSLHAGENINKLLPRLNINLIVLALTAQKQGLQLSSLMNDLINGYYSKYTGVASLPPETIANDEIIYPSSFIRSYDWQKIDQLHEMREKEKQVLRQIEQNGQNDNKGDDISDSSKKDILLKFLGDMKQKNGQ